MTISTYGVPDSSVPWTQELEDLAGRIFKDKEIAYYSQISLVQAMKNCWPQLNARTELKPHAKLRRVTVVDPANLVEDVDIDAIRDHIERDTLYKVWRDLFDYQWPGFASGVRLSGKPPLRQSCANAFVKKYGGATDTFNFDRLSARAAKDLDILTFKSTAYDMHIHIDAAYSPTNDNLYYALED